MAAIVGAGAFSKEIKNCFGNTAYSANIFRSYSPTLRSLNGRENDGYFRF